MPIPDPDKLWGKKCQNCTAFCVRHYLSPEKAWTFSESNGPGCCVPPPREILKEFAKESDGFSEEDDCSFAKQCLSSEDDEQLWCSSIQRSRKKTDNKRHETERNAQARRKANREEQETGKHAKDTNDVHCLRMQPWGNRFMIQCDICEAWYHGSCVRITEEDGEELQEFYCDMCAA